MTTVLIVDDSKLARIVVKKALKNLEPDWDIVEAADAAEALGLIQNLEVDVAFIDFNMPGENGLDLAKKLRLSSVSVPIALVTANVQDDIITQARTLDVTFIGKPITADGLRGFVSGVALRLRVTKH